MNTEFSQIKNLRSSARICVLIRYPMTIEPDDLKLSFQLTARGDHLEVRATAPLWRSHAETLLPSPALLGQLAEFDSVHMPLAPLQSAARALPLPGRRRGRKLAADVLLEAPSARQPASLNSL